MHAWKKSACVVLAWSILSITLMAVGMKGSVHPAQANTRTTRSTEIIRISTLSVAAAPMTATWPPAGYVVQPGDSLAGIAARFAVRGGWSALYAANRPTIHPGTVLTVPQSASPSLPAPGLADQPHPASPPSPPAGTGHHPRPVTKAAPAASGMPSWLKTLLLAVGLLILVAFLAGPVLAVRRRRQQAAGRAVQLGTASVGRRRDRGARSRSVAGAVRPVVAAARVHPAGVAVPCALLVTGIVLFTFVTSATIRVVPPPGRSGPGSVRAARPRTDQPHHRLQPRQPGQPARPSTPGQNARCLTGSLEQIASPLRVPAAAPRAGSGQAPQASRDPSARLPGGGLVCDVKQVPSSAATAAAASGGADQ